jgi:KDO2-lipid IV(A) lauroyltransferase
MFSYLLYRLGQFLAFCLPRRLAYALAGAVSFVHSALSLRDTREACENLRTIFPQKSRRELLKIRFKLSYNFAKYLVDFFRYAKIDAGYIKRNVTVSNIHRLEGCLQKGKGVILVTAHLGNWELGGVIVAMLGFPIWGVALPHKNRRVNRFFDFQRGSRGLRVIHMGQAVRKCFAVLRNNHCLALVGDRDFANVGVVVDFFGKPASFPNGAAILSLRTGAAIIPAFFIRKGDDTFELSIEEPLAFSPSGREEEDVRGIISRYTKIFEAYIRRHPDQWYMFRRFWLNEGLRNHTHL